MSGLTSLKKRRRIQVMSIAGVCVALVLVLLAMLPDDSFQFFRSPSEVTEAPPPANERFRIGGLVEEGTLVRGAGEEISFHVTDGGASVQVIYAGILPDLFGEGQGMVAQGHYVDGRFEAVEILAKHDETYMPSEVIDALKEQGTYVAPDGAPAIN
ncbi:cytochrome c maturation protein CcmE [Yoonia sediminilitoris]|uniref:Cytochrome c-type biogenesis protein CcmE n=1 Tax=Yoonia sediminilitoris TaxID=1286148 RepID=A0A2T6KRU4_9RHOB|nr:cytochrome c maturation protein CcmE [Yoonia sediminilitoris]PUB19281.1 cytochrome c-type biogenesis protein CcmE [Yoonia sediminilitoris]RCW99449.1 cytochrome c-type biogenesis protein CcmE [Yoonia sediminilitoris]